MCFNRTAISIQKIDSKSSKSHLKSLPRISPKSYRHRLYLKPFLIAIFNFSHKRPTFALTPESGYTLGFRRKMAHSGLHAETRAFQMGGGIITLGALRTFENLPGPGTRTANFAALGAWSRVLPKNAESLRDSDAHDARRCPVGVAAPLGCVIFFASVEIAACSSCTQGFLRVQGRRGITTLGVLCVLLKRWTAACKNG